MFIHEYSMSFQKNTVKTAILKSLNKNLSSISKPLLSLILNDTMQYLEDNPTQEAYDCPPDSWEDPTHSTPNQLEGSLDSNWDRSLDERNTDVLISDSDTDMETNPEFLQELNQAGAKWKSYVNEESHNKFKFNFLGFIQLLLQILMVVYLVIV